MQTKYKDIKSRIVKPITLVGLMGSGKSMLGKRLAKQLDMPFADSDKAIEDAAGLTISDIFDIAGDANSGKWKSASSPNLLQRGR